MENKGQWNTDFRYRAALGGASIFLRNNGFRILLMHPGDMAKLDAFRHGSGSDSARYVYYPDGAPKDKKKNSNNRTAVTSPAPGDGGGGSNPPAPDRVRGHSYDIQFLNAAANPEIIPSKPTQDNISYFIGNDPSKWKSGIGAYTNVLYKNMYPNIDVQVYSESSQLKYDVIVHPGANASDIKLQYNGATSVTLKKGNLHIRTTVGEAIELAPYAYQYINSQRKTVKVEYQLSGNTVTYKISGRYDNQYPLVIDPTVVFATLSGSRAENWGFTATYDAGGNFYGGGIAFDQGYPVSAGVYDGTFNGRTFDMAITKFNPNGSRIVYSTYIGGMGEEQPCSMFVDAAGNLVISGRTNSGNFPALTNVGPGGGSDIVVVKLNANGSALIGSMRIGGSGLDGANMRGEKGGSTDVLLRNYGDDARSEVVVDGGGNIYVASSTQSTNFPATAGSFQPAYGGGRQDAVVMKINPNCNALLWATFLGGSAEDAAYVLAVNGGNSVYVAGGTASSNFPSRSGVYSTYRGGACDGYIAHLSADGSTLLSSTFMGSENGKADQVYGIQLDRQGAVYVMGTTEGNWPIMQPAGTPTFYNDNSKQFITKLRPDLSALIYSTTFGKNASSPSLSPVAFLVDRCQNVYVSGWGGELNQGAQYANSDTRNLRVTPDARKSRSDGSDFYFFVMKRDALDILYGSFYGGDGLFEHVDGGTSRFDQNGVIYQAICASCPLSGGRIRFPTTPGSYYTGFTDGCNLGALKIAFNLDGVRAGFTTQERRRNYCVPANIQFIDTTNVPAQSWTWNFGDGSPDVVTTVPTTSHSYPTVGDYRVRLVKYDPASCNLADTAYMDIRVREDRAPMGFTEQRLPPCTALEYLFVNTSTHPPGKPFTNTSFTWNFGDNTPLVITDTTRQVHRFASEGIYTVSLTLTDTNYCNAPETQSIQLRVAANVVAAFTVQDSSCAPFIANFDNISKGGVTFNWDFGDGTTSTDPYPTHTYSIPGRYPVRLEAFDPNTCNQRHDTTIFITVMPPPTAQFTYQPNKPVENTPHMFTNQSTGATHYRWDFGDGNTSTEVNPTYQYLRTGTYDVCLIAFTEFGCTDTTCQQVSAIVNPLYDVPTAFSPNGDGVNDIWEIKGFGIVHYDMKVFNRWGQLVFQSNDQKLGWNGRFNGTVQPLDAYAFVLNIEFSDGNKVTKTGNVTLLR
ncbi:gliding motility-associated C-terminal domain-containing protein [Chitinophaga barathri]|uniref:gliding motility-associated C-terminal domain-containing protein n=1 Tax=Chitinophaga barathri TaxID=1647451 RepID=UPI001F4D6A3E|nr:PKD domain-containing protein [Chitinophaga barathri]